MTSEAILRDFSEPNVCGIDCKYNDLYLFIEQELDKDNSVTQEEGTNWHLVLKNCEELLINHTKDLKIATWWLYANFKLKSVDGLLYGLDTYISLIEKYLIDIYPKSKKSRTNILYWFETNLSNDIEKDEDCIKSMKNNKKFNTLLNKLDLAIKNISNENKNNFKALIKLTEPLIKNANSQISGLNQIQEIKKEPTIGKSAIQEFLEEINTDSDATKVLRIIKKNASLLADFYRKKDFSDLRALKITRFLSWFDIDGLPYSSGKKTSLYPPSDMELDLVDELYRTKRYVDALYLIEEILEVCPFWFDGHFYAFNIFEQTNNITASLEVKNSFVSFLKSNNGILDFYFINDSPFASAKTKKWIEKELVNNQQNDEELNIGKIKESEFYLEKIYETANLGKVKEAIEMFQTKYFESSNVEEKFNWRFKQSQFAVEYEKKDIALALLEELEKDIDKYHLTEWNPKLASKVYTMLLNNFTNLDLHIDKLNFIYKNLCKTDVNSAFEIKI